MRIQVGIDVQKFKAGRTTSCHRLSNIFKTRYVAWLTYVFHIVLIILISEWDLAKNDEQHLMRRPICGASRGCRSTLDPICWCSQKCSFRIVFIFHGVLLPSSRAPRFHSARRNGVQAKIEVGQVKRVKRGGGWPASNSRATYAEHVLLFALDGYTRSHLCSKA